MSPILTGMIAKTLPAETLCKPVILMSSKTQDSSWDKKVFEKEIKSLSGNKLDYVGVKAATAIDFRGDNMLNFESLEKNSIDLYAATKSLYLQDRQQKILNSQKIVETQNDSDWEEIETQ